MIYRPQFPYPFPKDCHQQRCHYSFDSTNTPSLNTTLAAGIQTSAIPLQMDKDADFFLRGWQVAVNNAVVMTRIVDPYNNPLSDDGNSSQLANFVFPQLSSITAGASPVALESQNWGIFCPAGSNFNLFVYNPTTDVQDLTDVFITFHGVKMYSNKRCGE